MRLPTLSGSRFRPGKVCFGCKEKVYFLQHCQNRDRYLHHLQYYCNIADIAASLLSNVDTEFDYKAHEVFGYFLKAEEEVFHCEVSVEEVDLALDTWLVELFDILDDCLPKTFGSIHQQHHLSSFLLLLHRS